MANEIELISATNIADYELQIYGTPEEPLFLAKGVAKILEMRDGNAVARMVDDNEKGTQIVSTPGGAQQMTVLTEDGLYEVIFQSRKPIAKQFKKHVKTVLKELRKNGMYVMGEEDMSDEELTLVVMERLRKKIENQKREIEQAKPKVDFFNAVAEATSFIDMQKFSDLIAVKGLGRNNMYKWCVKNKILFKRGSDYLPYRQYIESGYFKNIEQVYSTRFGNKVGLKLLISTKGQQWLTKKLEEAGKIGE